MATLKQRRIAKVLERMAVMAMEDESYSELFDAILELDSGLDRAIEFDAFGAKGQCDPRGDQRCGPWTMDRVQGVDD